jgi:hypothetical protein
MTTETTYDEFLADWENGLIQNVTGAGNRLYGQSVKGQADNPQGYIIVYCIVPI